MSAVPVAPKRPHAITQHGITRIDDYYWMRFKDDPQVLAYLQAENDYLEETMQHTQLLQEKLYQEMKGRIKEDDSTVPERRDHFYYYQRNEAGKQYPIFCRKQGSLEAPEEILLDQNALTGENSFCRIGAFAVSPDHQMLAYSIDPDGSEICTLYIKNLVDGALFPEVIANTYGNVYGHTGVEWAASNRSLFYITLDAAQRPNKLFRHDLGSSVDSDELVYHEADDTYFLFLGKTRSRKFLTVHSRSTITDEWRILPADTPEDAIRIFASRRHGIEYRIHHWNDRFFITTNEDAPNFKLMQTPLTATSSDNWIEVIPHRQDVMIEDAAAFANNLVLIERKDGLQHIRISDGDGISQVRYVPFPEPVYTISLATNPDYVSRVVRFNYSSLVTPNSVIDFHMADGKWELKKQDEIPSGHDPSAYVSQRLYATASDGARIPISLVFKKGLEMDGQNPTLLYGYGSYGFSADPGFNANRFSLIERGFVYAIAHIRGGSELGRAWYEDGKMLNKRNTFTDFIACAVHLIAQRYTSKEKLGIMGGSAGGLLMGACMTMRPDLFHAVVAKVPFVDVVTTMSDPSIPLTTLEYDQWGNPDDPTYFNYIRSYSPYDNIQAAEYPHLLITTGLNDPRVAFWEPAKFAAKLRAMKLDDHLLLLKTNMEAGHAGASGRYDYLKEVALDYAFLIDRLIDNP